jgi:hypothetical protein
MAGWAEAAPAARAACLLSLLHQMTILDGLAPAEVHEAFLAIDEYREFCRESWQENEAEAGARRNPFADLRFAYGADFAENIYEGGAPGYYRRRSSQEGAGGPSVEEGANGQGNV